MENFEVAREEKGNVSILKLKGYLDAHTAPQFEQALQQLVNENRFNIIVNLQDLVYISSAGLGVFMSFIEDIREQGGDIKITNLSPKVYKIFDLLGFPKLYDILDDEAEAIEKFAS